MRAGDGQALALAVDPAVAEGGVEGLVVGDGGLRGGLLADAEPDALGGGGVVGVEPGGEVGGGGEEHGVGVGG